MRVIDVVSVLFGLSGTAVASPAVAVPKASSVVASVTASFAAAVLYTGPTGSASYSLKTSSTSKSIAPVATPETAAVGATPYWLELINHQGISASNSNPSSYQVFRNVKDFGAKGDGITDDTAAINLAMSSGGRCAPGSCNSATTTPAVVYFPAGTYLISSSIIDYYYTQIIGNPNSLPVLKATPNFSGFGLIDGDQYGANGLKFGATNIFYHQIRNMIFDLTGVTSSSSVTAIHWPTAQATGAGHTLINNCTTGLNMAGGGRTAQSVGSVTFLDSSFTNTQVAIVTAHDSTSLPITAGSLILDNVSLVNTPVAVQGPEGAVVAGGTLTISGWGQGHEYTPSGPVNFEVGITSFPRPSSLTIKGKFYARSKPQYQASPLSQFVSVRTAGAKGNGLTDDTAALTSILKSAAAAGQIVFFDAGTYKVTSTLFVPPGSKIVGESFSVIMASGSFFSSITSPKPVVLVGNPGQTGIVEWSDMIVSTQGATAGAILIEWNLASTASSPSGMWDVHTRIGGFTGSNLQLSQCPTSNGVVKSSCIAAWMSMYIAPTATGLYMENNWFWTADHDIDDPNLSQITIYSGRGLYCSSTSGTIWLYGTAVEHHDLYQYQFANTQNVFLGQIQTGTAYWQPAPKAGTVFPIVAGWNDPVFASSCVGVNGNCAMGWGLRVVSSTDILVYGAGLYSFFNNYSVACSNSVTPPGNGGTCQTSIFSIEGSHSKNIDVYNLNTVGSTQMVIRDGKNLATFSDNVNVYPDTIAYFRTN